MKKNWRPEGPYICPGKDHSQKRGCMLSRHVPPFYGRPRSGLTSISAPSIGGDSIDECCVRWTPSPLTTSTSFLFKVHMPVAWSRANAAQKSLSPLLRGIVGTGAISSALVKDEVGPKPTTSLARIYHHQHRTCRAQQQQQERPSSRRS